MYDTVLICCAALCFALGLMLGISIGFRRRPLELSIQGWKLQGNSPSEIEHLVKAFQAISNHAIAVNHKADSPFVTK